MDLNVHARRHGASRPQRTTSTGRVQGFLQDSSNGQLGASDEPCATCKASVCGVVPPEDTCGLNVTTWTLRLTRNGVASVDLGDRCRPTAVSMLTCLCALLITMGPPHGPPSSSDGPSATCKANACKTICPVETSYVVQQANAARGTARPTHGTRLQRLRHGQQDAALKLGPRGSHAMAWPQWTSETDVGQQPPAKCCTCLCELLITIGPSDDRSGPTFQKFSSWTAFSLTQTADGMRCVGTVGACNTSCRVKTSDLLNRPTNAR